MISFARPPVSDRERGVDVEHEITQTSQAHTEEHSRVHRNSGRPGVERSKFGNLLLNRRHHAGMDNRFKVSQCSRVGEHDTTEPTTVYLPSAAGDLRAESFDDPLFLPAQGIVTKRVNINALVPGLYQDVGCGGLAGTVLAGDPDDDQWRAPQLSPNSTDTRSGTVSV